MTIYIIGIVVFSITFIVSLFLLIYFIKDEKNLKEVSNQDLMSMGKFYTKTDFEEKIFNQYTKILESSQYADYSFLKDAVSDQIYNQILLKLKQNQDLKQEEIITDIKMESSKLVAIYKEKNLEVAKVLVNYSSIEYIKKNEIKLDENNQEIVNEIIVQGSKDIPVNHECILTFVKDKTDTETIVCPNCGYQEQLVTSSRCIRCDLDIVPKTGHWVFVQKQDVSQTK